MTTSASRVASPCSAVCIKITHYQDWRRKLEKELAQLDHRQRYAWWQVKRAHRYLTVEYVRSNSHRLEGGLQGQLTSRQAMMHR